MSTEIDMQKVCDLVHLADIPAYVEQTGGGCATIYAGRCFARPRIDPDPSTKLWDVAAGPGWFEGPGWTLPKGDVEDFYVGADDMGEGEFYTATATDTEETLAARIVALVAANPDKEEA